MGPGVSPTLWPSNPSFESNAYAICLTRAAERLVTAGSTARRSLLLTPRSYQPGLLPELDGYLVLGGGSRLDAFSGYPVRRSCPACPIEQLVDQRPQAPVPLVPRGLSLQVSTRPAQRNQPVSRRSKPISRSALTGEQPYPWQLLHCQDAERRRRSSKPPGRCELLLETTQLSLG